MGNRCRGTGGYASFTQTNSPPQAFAVRQPVACGPAETCQTSWGALVWKKKEKEKKERKKTPTLPSYPDPSGSMKTIFHLKLQCKSFQSVCVKKHQRREETCVVRLLYITHKKVVVWRNPASWSKFVSRLCRHLSLSLHFRDIYVLWLFIKFLNGSKHFSEPLRNYSNYSSADFSVKYAGATDTVNSSFSLQTSVD